MSRQFFQSANTVKLFEDADSEALRFVPEPKRKGEHWIEVKSGLNYGEQQALEAALLRRVPASVLTDLAAAADLDVAIETANTESVAAWLVDWSFTDGQNPPQKVELSRDAIAALTPEVGQAIYLAILDHAEATAVGKGRPTGRTRAGAKPR